jgi:hypothetical protein
MVQGLAKSQALKYAVELFKQYTWNLEGRVNQLFPPPAPNPSFHPIPIPTSNTANEANALGARYGYYTVELSKAVLNMTENFTQEATEATNRQATSRQPTISIASLQQHPQAAIPVATYPCLSCQNNKRKCDRVLPAQANEIKSTSNSNAAFQNDCNSACLLPCLLNGSNSTVHGKLLDSRMLLVLTTVVSLHTIHRRMGSYKLALVTSSVSPSRGCPRDYIVQPMLRHFSECKRPQYLFGNLLRRSGSYYPFREARDRHIVRPYPSQGIVVVIATILWQAIVMLVQYSSCRRQLGRKGANTSHCVVGMRELGPCLLPSLHSWVLLL